MHYRVPEGEEREKEPEKIFEKIIAESFQNLGKGKDIQVQEVQRNPNRMNPKRNTLRHIIIKMVKVKDKERILKAGRKTNLLYTKETP